MKRKILIAIDGSAHSKRAIDWYADNMNSEEDTLLFVNVSEPPQVSSGDNLGIALVSAAHFKHRMQSCIGRAHQLSAMVQEKMDNLELHKPFRFVHRFSSQPGAAIVAVAEEENAVVILIGNRGVGIARRTFLGSVSSFVLHHSHIPVIVLPPSKNTYRFEDFSYAVSSLSASSSSSSSSLSTSNESNQDANVKHAQV